MVGQGSPSIRLPRTQYREYFPDRTFTTPPVFKTELGTCGSAPSRAGGLFAPIQPPKANTSLFGSSLSTSQPQQNNTQLSAGAPPTNQGLFSQGANNQQQATGNLLGGLSTQNLGNQFSQQNQSQRTSLLGPGAGQQSLQQSAGAGLFATQQAQPQQGGVLFSSLGQNQAQTQSQQPQGGLLVSFGQNKAPSMLFVAPFQLYFDTYP